MRQIFTLLYLLCSCTLLSAQPLGRAQPESMGMDGKRLADIDGIIENSIKAGEIPGAVIAVVRGDKMIYLKSYGNKSVYPQIEKMTDDTIFDLASISKPISTAIAIMQLLEQGKIRLTDDVAMYIPGYQGYKTASGEEVPIRIEDLLTHTSGLPSYGPTEELIQQYGSPSPEGLLQYIATCKRDFRPATKFRYSCLNFISLQHILQNITGMRLEEYSQNNIFDVLGLKHTVYNPVEELLALVAPTEKQRDGTVISGKVHDPLARLLNDGNSGNAGVFSNAEDLAVIAAAMMNGGEYDGRRILGELTVQTMTKVPERIRQFGRSLGWDNYSEYASNNGNIFHPVSTYGHTGYTGTSIVIDPSAKVSVILLTHRVHPVDKGSVVRLRALVANAVAGAVTEACLENL